MTGTPSTYCAEHYPDDPNIAGDTNLLRRIPPTQIVYDDNLNQRRPSSQAFRDDQDGDPMSVYLSSVLAAEDRPASAVLEGHDGFAVAAVTAELARSLSQTVHPDPIPEESSHAVVCGDKDAKSRKVAKTFAKAAIWIVNPPEPAK